MSDTKESNKGVFVTPKIRKYILKAFAFGKIFNGLPFKWDHGLQKAVMISHSRQKLWCLNISLAFAYVVFVLVRCVQVSMDSKSSYFQKVNIRIMAAYFSLSAVMHLTIIIHREKMPIFINRFLGFSNLMHETYVRSDAQPVLLSRVSGFVMRGVWVSINCITCLMSLNAFLRPGSKEQVTSIFVRDEKSISIGIRIISGCLMGFIEYMYHSSTFMLTLSALGYMAPVLVAIDELSSKTCKLTRDKLRHSLETIKIYELLSVLMKSFNGIYASFLIPCFEFLGIVIIVFCTYAAIRMDGIQAMAFGFLGFVMCITLVIIFSFLAEFHHRSCKVLVDIKERNVQRELLKGSRNCLLQRYFKSLRPLKVTLRSYYFVDRCMVLTMVNIIVQNTVTFLLYN